MNEKDAKYRSSGRRQKRTLEAIENDIRDATDTGEEMILDVLLHFGLLGRVRLHMGASGRGSMLTELLLTLGGRAHTEKSKRTVESDTQALDMREEAQFRRRSSCRGALDGRTT